MNVYVIHPGAGWSTSDVYTGLVSGLKAQSGITVYEGRIDSILNWYDTAIHCGVQAGAFTANSYSTQVLNRQRMASAHITQNVLDIWPDVVISVSGHNYHLDDVDILRRVGIRTAVLLTESPYFGELEGTMARHYDIAFTNERRSAARLNAHYLPHAYNPAVHTPDGPHAPASDVVFIGSMFDERKQLLTDTDWTGINFVWRGHDMTETPADVVPNNETAAHYRAAKIGLNHHRTTTSHGSGKHIRPEEAESLGPRAYEIPACGCFQLMDDTRLEAREVFRDSLATYKAGDPADLRKQVAWWLDHPDMRQIWAAAQRACVQPHAWDVRARQVMERIV
jgi:spore maturation protein CgeB